MPTIEDFQMTTSDKIRYGDTGTALQSGTKVTKVGRSSITFEQGLFQTVYVPQDQKQSLFN